jgi:hypothetical protein
MTAFSTNATASAADLGRAVAAALLCATAACGVARGQEAGAPSAAEAAQAAGAPDEVVVIGQRLLDLRRRIEAAEVAVFDRFNDINSDDRFDIHCRYRVRYFSHTRERVCESNSWREQDENYAQSLLQQVRGEATPPPATFRAEQLRMNALLGEELGRLAAEDPGLREAMQQLAAARFALAEEIGTTDGETASIEISSDEGGLPFAAQRVFAVRMGRTPWSHTLTERTFTLAEVTGVVRGLEIECGGQRRRLAYEAAVEWTLPEGLRECILVVNAKRDTRFTLYEFQ